MSDLPPQPDSPVEPPPTTPKRRRGLWLVLALLSLLGMVLAGAMTLAVNDAAFAWLVREAAKGSAGRFQVAGVQGSLWHGFGLNGVRYQDATQRVEIDRLQLAWQPRALWGGELHITELALGHVRLTTLKPAAPKPLIAPSALTLPLEVRLDRLTLASLTETGSPLALYDGQASYRYHDGQHRLQLERLASPWGRAGLSMTLADRRPFALSGKVSASGELEGVPYDAALKLGGNLLQPQVLGTLNGKGMLAELNGRLAPFEPLFFRKVSRLDLRVGGINPFVLNPVWPKARLNLALSVEPDARGNLIGGATLINLAPGHAAAQQIPLTLLSAGFSVSGDTLLIRQSHAELTSGTIDLNGTVNPRAMALEAKLAGIRPDVLWPGAPKPPLGGRLALTGSMQQPVVTVDLSDGRQRAQGRVLLDNRSGQRAVTLDKLRVGSGNVVTEIDARLGLDAPLPLRLNAKLAHANLAQLGSGWPTSDLNGVLRAEGQLGAPQRLALALTLAPSKLNGANLSGTLQGQYGNGRLSGLNASLRQAENHLEAHGGWGGPNDRLMIKIDAPALQRLGPGFAGALRGSVDLSGNRTHPLFDLVLKAERLTLPGGISARLLDASGQLQADPRTPFKLGLNASDVNFASLRIDTLKLSANGTRASHQLTAQGAFKLAGRPHQLDLAAAGGLAPQRLDWQGVVSRFNLSGDAGVALAAPVRLSASSERVSLSPTRLALLGGNVRLDSFDWQRGKGLVTRGSAGALALARIEPWVKLPVEQNLVVAADWDLALAGTPSGRLTVKRLSGDFVVPGAGGRKRAFGLEQAELSAALGGGRTQLALVVQSALLQLNGRASLLAPHGMPDGNSPLSGTLQLNLPSLAALGPLAGPEVGLGGALQANLTLSGTPNAPLWRGPVSGSQLVFTDRHSGFKLADGELAADVDGRTLLLKRLRFAGGKGEVVAAGRIDAREIGPNASATVTFKQFTVFDTPQRRLIVSGQSELSFNDKGIKLTGRLRADKGRLDLPKEGAPALSKDVVVKGRAPAQPSTFASLPITATLDLDFGDRFLLVGRGLDVALTGTVRVNAEPGHEPTAVGQVSIVEGRYRAYNQDLDIQRGVITFNGPFDNPALSVRATRRLSPVGAGVEVSGTVAQPTLRLIADEPMTDKDKLAWLVLGHAASAGGGDDAALAAAAAGSWLAGSANQHIGLFDDLGVVNRSEKTYANGQVSPAEQVVVVGRQVSRNLYIGYEYGIKSAEQALKLAYQLTKGWSLVLHAGRDSSVETRFTLRFD